MKRERRAATLAKLGVTGVRQAVQAGGGHSFRAIAAIASRKRPPARETGKQAQNLTALAVDRSGHLVRKYRLTYHRQ
ncbi:MULTISPECIES: hypothetical protein [unclassified Microcoleus]|uniref:hypothetical protein n=1 Tax=unclassified Microcoleus TaxID=2642155 RepID=UPI002FD5AB8E